MRKMMMLVAVLAVTVACPKGGGGGGEASVPAPQSEQDKTFYALGLSIGRSLGVFNLSPTELDYVKKGMTDSITKQKPLVELDQYGPKIQELARTRSQQKAEAEKKAGQAYLEKAAAEPGAEKLPSGLIYKELTPGTGPQPEKTDVVKVNYKGTLTDGTEFDSSYKRGQPAQFALNQVIPCWTEGVAKMKVGGKARLVCPSSIAYGDRGAPPTIPGGATLVFEVELLDIVQHAPPPTPATPPTPAPTMTPPGGKPGTPPAGAPAPKK